MIYETTECSKYWRKCGDEARAHNVRGIVMLVRLLFPIINKLADPPVTLHYPDWGKDIHPTDTN